MIQVTSTLMAHDYAAEGVRTPETLGIGDLTAEEIGAL